MAILYKGKAGKAVFVLVQYSPKEGKRARGEAVKWVNGRPTPVSSRILAGLKRLAK